MRLCGGGHGRGWWCTLGEGGRLVMHMDVLHVAVGMCMGEGW